MDLTNERIHVVGLGGTLRESSTSRWALEHALKAAENAGATTELLALADLDLPMFKPGKALHEYGPSVARLVAAARATDAMIWSTAGYHGTIAGATKNALDFLEFLAKDEMPYLQDRVVGLIATAAGELAAVNALNAMVHTAHALRATVAPQMVAIPRALTVFDHGGRILDPQLASRLEWLGRRVVDLAAKYQPARLDLVAA